MTTADVRDVQTALMWLSGSLHAANWMLVGISACWMLPAALYCCSPPTADIALLGHQVATGLGVNSSRLALLRVAAPIILTAVCVSCVGNIGFVGLIAPHISRFILRGGQTTLLLGSAVSGALLVIWRIALVVWLFAFATACRNHYFIDWWTILFATALAAQEQFLMGVICVYFFLC